MPTEDLIGALPQDIVLKISIVGLIVLVAMLFYAWLKDLL